MLTLIENADIYAPQALGVNHLLVGGGQILHIAEKLPDPGSSLPVKRIDLEGARLIPGFIDAHVHITGGGGEDGFSTQAPAVPLSQFTRHGVTSVVGLLGTDDETRSTENLVARTYALREEGLSAWCWTGGYHVPVTTLTGSVRKDIVSVECIIGLGELALSDHRSSQPTLEELARLAADTHVAGLISRKAGVVHLHLGDGERGLSMVQQLLADTELPSRVFHPTHVNRRRALFEEACELSHSGVHIDVTTFAVAEGEDGYSAADAWEAYQQANCPHEHFTMSSDGGGCLPVFDNQGQLQSMDFASSEGLASTLSDLLERGHALEKVLPSITINVARLLRLSHKGRIAGGMDADLVCLDEHHRPRHVMARGQWVVRDYQVIRRGMFEHD